MYFERRIRTAFRGAGGVIGALIALVSAPAGGATFDCSAYSAYVDRVTCEDQRLSALDAELDRILDRLRRQNPTATKLINETAGKRKDKLYADCSSVDCVSGWYEGEIRAIREGTWAPPPPIQSEIQASAPANDPAAKSSAPASRTTLNSATYDSNESVPPRGQPTQTVTAAKADLAAQRAPTKSDPSFFAIAVGVVVGVLVFPLSWLLCGFLIKYGVSNWEKNRRSALEMVYWRGVVSIMLAVFAGKSLTTLLS